MTVATLLEVVVTFVGVMFALALVAESLQELVKTGFALKGITRRHALEGLIVEAARAIGKGERDGKDIVNAVVARLRGLGQKGIRPGAIRLDAVDAKGLRTLIERVDPNDVNGLQAMERSEAVKKLTDIGEQAERWFALAMNPVDDRYRRRMRWLAMLTSLAVVLLVNADAGYVIDQARNDPAYRRQVAQLVSRLDTLRARRDSLQCREEAALGRESPAAAAAQPAGAGASPPAAQAPASPAPAGDTACARILALRDTVNLQIARQVMADSGFTVGRLGQQRWGDMTWWIGILISTLLVSLGAPFWHDLLESIFALKSKVRAQVPDAAAEEQRRAAQAEAAARR